MKKIISLFAAAAMIFAGTTPAKADVTYFDDWQWWNFTHTNAASISYSGSLKTGESYTVTVAGSTPNSESCEVQLKLLDSGDNVTLGERIGVLGAFSITSSSLTAGPTNSWENFGTVMYCASGIYHTSFMTTTFESPISAPANFTVFPQGSGTAFTTWGVADGATSYTVTAAPGGRSCTSTQNFCEITGLTNGETYTFTLTATNGTASSSMGSGPVLMRQPVTVAVALSSATWKVGDSATAQVAVQGQGGLSITWYRCDQIVGAMPTAPTDCTPVGSGTSPSYTLTSADVGKYITAHVFVNNTDPQGQMTASNSNAVLATGAVAPAPVADPAGKPTIVNIPNPIVSVAGGTQVTITGTGLAGVTAVTVGGLPAIVVSKTDTTVVVQVPVSTKTGLADLTVTNDKGSVTSKSAIVYTTNPVIKITKTRTITGFTANQRVLTNGQKAAVRTLLTANPTLTELTCAARTTGVKASKTELAKARTLATATCTYAKSLKKTLVTKTSAAQTLPKAKASRSVLLTLKN